MNSDNPCPCGSGQSFSNCCQPYIQLQVPAPTAQALMRSRFTAFSMGNIDYLIHSHHPKQRKENDREVLAKSIAHCQWLKLAIVKTKRGLSTDSTGEVSFVASFTEDGQFRQLYEQSRFTRENDQWYYTDGDIIETIPKTYQWPRNANCWCASGKKFKLCHGR